MTDSFKPVSWVNEANGQYPQFFAVPNFEDYINLGFHFNQQNTQNMTNTTFPAGIESTSLSAYVMPINIASYDEWA